MSDSAASQPDQQIADATVTSIPITSSPSKHAMNQQRYRERVAAKLAAREEKEAQRRARAAAARKHKKAIPDLRENRGRVRSDYSIEQQKQRKQLQLSNAEYALQSRNLMSREEIAAAAESSEFPDPVHSSVIMSSVADAAEALKANDVVCAICSLHVPANTEHDQHYEEWTLYDLFVQHGKKVHEKLHHSFMPGALLRVNEDAALLEQYNMADILGYEPLRGLLLSKHPRAYVHATAPGVMPAHPAVLRICNIWHCAQSLKKDSLMPPPFALSNNNITGQLPADLSDLTWPEAAITSLVYGCARINVLKGGAQKALQGHITTMEQNIPAMTKTIAEHLPRTPEATTFRVVMAGALTPVQKLASLKVHQVRRDKIHDVLKFYKQRNPLYKDVVINLDNLQCYKEDSSLLDLQHDNIHPEEAKGLAAAEAMGAAAAHGSLAPTDVEHEQSLLVRHIATVSETAPNAEERGVSASAASDNVHTGPEWHDAFTDAARHLQAVSEPIANDEYAAGASAAAAANLTAPRQSVAGSINLAGTAFAIRCGSNYVPEGSAIYTKMFPDLFPYGRGGMEEPRRVPLSLNRWALRLMRESSGRFSGSAAFVLKVYNISARTELSKRAYVRVQLGDMTFQGLTAKDVRELVRYQLACSEALRTHQVLPDPPATLPSSARELFRTTELCNGEMKHTDQYAKKYGRLRVFSMWNRYGPPALMLTLNPNDLASMMRLYYSGHLPADGSVPPASVFASSLGECPGAAALDFQRKLDVFIRHVIGYDLKLGSPVQRGGVYGPVLALFGAVEEQNRGSLHAHILVWLPGVRPFSQLPAMDGSGWEELRQRIGAFVQSIMTAEVQCPAALIKCPREAQHQSTSTSAAAAADHAHVSLTSVRDEHIGQISDVRPFRLPLRAQSRGHSIGPPLIATCLKSVAASASASASAKGDKSEQRPFSVQSAALASVAHAREFADLPPVDMTSTSAFNQWSAATGPLPFVPAETADEMDRVRYLANIATIQLGCMSHDPAHRATCMKKGPDTECRFHFPFKPCVLPPGEVPVQFVTEDGQPWMPLSSEPQLQAAAVRATAAESNESKNADDASASSQTDAPYTAPAGITITLPRGGLSAYQNQCNVAVTGLYQCNNDVKFVQDPGSAYYITLYHVKTHDEERKQLLDMLAAIDRSHKYMMIDHPTVVQADSSLVHAFTSTMQLTLRCARAASSSSAVSATNAAYYLLGGDRFISSEQWGFIMLGSTERFLRGDTDTMSAQLISAATALGAACASDDENEQEVSKEAESAEVRRPASSRRLLNFGAAAASSAAAAAGAAANPSEAAAQAVEAGDDDAVQMYAVSGLDDYQHRNGCEEMQSLSWWEYEQSYQRWPRPKGLKDVDEQKGLFAFAPQHPLAAKFCSKLRERAVTPIVYGDRLPDVRPLMDLEDTSLDEAREVYAFRAMLLLTPFDAHALRKERTWQEWSRRLAASPADGGLSHCVRRILDNMQSYWLGCSTKSRLQLELGEPVLPAVEGEVDEDGMDAEEDDRVLNDQLQAAMQELADDVANESTTVKLVRESGTLQQLPVPLSAAQTPLSAIMRPACSDRELSILNNQLKNGSVPQQGPGVAAASVGASAEPAAAAAVTGSSASRLNLPGRTDLIAHTGAQEEDEVQQAPQNVQDGLELLALCKDRKGPVEVSAAESTEAALATLRHVIATMQLNTKQTAVFVLLARQFLAVVFGIDLDEAASQAAQRVMSADLLGGSEAAVDLHPNRVRQRAAASPVLAFLGGAAGTGKSRVINALQMLFSLCNCSRNLLVTATTGVAAVALNSCTIHSALNLLSTGTDANVVSKLKKSLSAVTLIIVDEISMLEARHFVKMERRLSSIRPSAGPFGGVSMLLVGDFCQFDAVGSSGLTKQDALGAQLWREHVTTVLMLEEQMRQADNPEFAAHLQAFRNGAVSSDDVSYFNTRCRPGISALDAQPALDPQVLSASVSTHYTSYIPIVVAENKDRVRINDLVALHMFERANRSASASESGSSAADHDAQTNSFFCIRASYEETMARENDAVTSHSTAAAGPGGGERGKPVVRAHKRAEQQDAGHTEHAAADNSNSVVLERLLSAICTRKTDHQLRYFPGMEVVITDNINVQLGIANGSRAFVVGVQLTMQGELEPAVFDEHGMRLYNARQVARLILHLLAPDGTPVTTLLSHDLPPGQFGLANFTDYEVMKVLKKNKFFKGVRFPSNYKRVQLPCVPAFAVTAHKTQGLTLSKLILAATLNKHNKAPTDRYLYVVLSRLRSLEGLTLLQPLPPYWHKCYEHTPALKNELERLNRLEAKTMSAAADLFKLLPPARVSQPSAPAFAPPRPMTAAERNAAMLRSSYERMAARMAAGDDMSELREAARAAQPRTVLQLMCGSSGRSRRTPGDAASAHSTNAAAFASDDEDSFGGEDSHELDADYAAHDINAAAFASSDDEQEPLAMEVPPPVLQLPLADDGGVAPMELCTP